MLSVTFKENGDVNFWIGHQEQLDNFKSSTVLQFQVDGHELELIKNQFDNLPSAHQRRVVIYTGDLAEFVIKNINLNPKTTNAT